MQMFPDDLPLANIDADGYCCHFMRSSVRSTIRGLGFVYCRQSAWKKWPTIWHADVSRWLTLSIHGCLWILLLVCLSVRLFVYRIFRCQCMSLEEKVYILAYWCIQITYPQFIDAYGYYWPFVGRFGFLGVGVGVGGWATGGFVTSLGDTGDICCHYWQHIVVYILFCFPGLELLQASLSQSEELVYFPRQQIVENMLQFYVDNEEVLGKKVHVELLGERGGGGGGMISGFRWSNQRNLHPVLQRDQRFVFWWRG